MNFSQWERLIRLVHSLWVDWRMGKYQWLLVPLIQHSRLMIVSISLPPREPSLISSLKSTVDLPLNQQLTINFSRFEVCGKVERSSEGGYEALKLVSEVYFYFYCYFNLYLFRRSHLTLSRFVPIPRVNSASSSHLESIPLGYGSRLSMDKWIVIAACRNRIISRSFEYGSGCEVGRRMKWEWKILRWFQFRPRYDPPVHTLQDWRWSQVHLHRSVGWFPIAPISFIPLFRSLWFDLSLPYLFSHWQVCLHSEGSRSLHLQGCLTRKVYGYGTPYHTLIYRNLVVVRLPEGSRACWEKEEVVLEVGQKKPIPAQFVQSGFTALLSLSHPATIVSEGEGEGMRWSRLGLATRGSEGSEGIDRRKERIEYSLSTCCWRI